MSIINMFGGMRREEVVRASKQTAPMLNAAQYEMLQFKPSEHIRQLQAKFLSDASFVQETKEALARFGNRISLEQLGAKVAEQSMV